MTAFDGRIYWVSANRDYLAFWDSSTGQITRRVTWDPAFPRRSDASTYADHLGVLTQTNDDRLLVRTDQGPDDAMALVFNTDLDLGAVDTWVNAATGANTVDSNSSGGVADAATGLNWLYWFTGDNSWTAFDSSGAVVTSAGDTSTDVEAYQIGHRGNAFIVDRWLYRTAYDYGEAVRYNLDTGAWEKAAFSGGFGSFALVGSCADGLVWLDTAASSALYGNVGVWPVDSLPWQPVGAPSGYYTSVAPLRSFSVLVAGTTPAFENNAWWGTVSVVGETLFYSASNPLADWGYDAGTGVPFGNAVTLWAVDLSSGAIASLLEIPYQFLTYDGTPVTYFDAWDIDTSAAMVGTCFAGVAAIARGRAPWLRQYPRSPLRHWPPERSYQRSNRRAGGYL